MKHENSFSGLLNIFTDQLKTVTEAARGLAYYSPVRQGGKMITSVEASASKDGYRGIHPCDLLPALLARPDLFSPDEAAELIALLTETVTGQKFCCTYVEPPGNPRGSFKPEMSMTPTVPFLWIRVIAALEKMAAPSVLSRIDRNRWLKVFRRSLEQVEFVFGLVFLNPDNPGVGFQFHDIVKISGCDLMSSIIACKGLEAAPEFFSGVADKEDIDHWQWLSERIRANLFRLYDPEKGVFNAGSIDCCQPDVMGSGLAAGLITEDWQRAIADFLYCNRDVLFHEGFTRYIVEEDGWHSLLTEDFAKNFPAGLYMNGGYWPSATGFVLPVLYTYYPDFALELAETAAASMRKYNFPESITKGGQVAFNSPYVLGSSMLVLATQAILSGGSIYDRI